MQGPDSVMIEIVKQAPTMGVLVWLVIYFFRHLERIAEYHERRTDERAEHSEKRYAELTRFVTDRMEDRTRRIEERENASQEVLRTALDRNSLLFERMLGRIGDGDHSNPGD